VIHCYNDPDAQTVDLLSSFLLEKLPFLTAIVLKKRNSNDASERNGKLVYGEKCDSFIEEHSVRYAIDITMNHDNGFYSDTRLLRKYLLENMQGKRVLNTFAYTGILGVAAAAGGAAEVVQTDLSHKFMSQSYRSASLNGFAFTRKNFIAGDFFPVTAALRKQKKEFDCVILDPPFFSTSARGVIDLAKNPAGVINKVRPLVADNGILIVVNNSLYLTGRALLDAVAAMNSDDLLKVEELIGVPEDFCFGSSDFMPYPADPAPFKHPTKIAVLRIRKRCK
jgi:23S rRNA (cytosine1962-C5)-methyltransferase